MPVLHLRLGGDELTSVSASVSDDSDVLRGFPNDEHASQFFARVKLRKSPLLVSAALRECIPMSAAGRVPVQQKNLLGFGFTGTAPKRVLITKQDQLDNRQDVPVVDKEGLLVGEKEQQQEEEEEAISVELVLSAPAFDSKTDRMNGSETVRSAELASASASTMPVDDMKIDGDDVHPARNFADQFQSPHWYFLPLLKSALQKAVRRRKANAAVNIAFQMSKQWTQQASNSRGFVPPGGPNTRSIERLPYANKGLDELLRRILIIACEDSVAILCGELMLLTTWLMCAVTKGWRTTATQLAAVLQLVRSIASHNFRDLQSLPETLQTTDLEGLLNIADDWIALMPTYSIHQAKPQLSANSDGRALTAAADIMACEVRRKAGAAILALRIRSAYGGMGGDIRMIRASVVLWIQRLSNFADTWASSDALKSIHTQPERLNNLPRVLPPSSQLSEGADFHCFPDMIPDLKNSLSGDVGAHLSADDIQVTIWHQRSGVYVRRFACSADEPLRPTQIGNDVPIQEDECYDAASLQERRRTQLMWQSIEPLIERWVGKCWEPLPAKIRPRVNRIVPTMYSRASDKATVNSTVQHVQEARDIIAQQPEEQQWQTYKNSARVTEQPKSMKRTGNAAQKVTGIVPHPEQRPQERQWAIGKKLDEKSSTRKLKRRRIESRSTATGQQQQHQHQQQQQPRSLLDRFFKRPPKEIDDTPIDLT